MKYSKLYLFNVAGFAYWGLAERRAHEQGLSLGIQARTRIKKAVEKLVSRTE
jgi:hypothetical protein